MRVTILKEAWETKKEALQRVMNEKKITEDDILTGRVKIRIIEDPDKTDPMYYPKK